MHVCVWCVNRMCGGRVHACGIHVMVHAHACSQHVHVTACMCLTVSVQQEWRMLSDQTIYYHPATVSPAQETLSEGHLHCTDISIDVQALISILSMNIDTKGYKLVNRQLIL